MPKEFILSDERLTDGADTVLKATLYQTRTLRNGKTIYVYTRNLDDINTSFGEIDEGVTAATTAACGGNQECINKVMKVKRASRRKVILEEGPIGEQLTEEQLADLNTGLFEMLAIEAEDDQLNDLLGALIMGGRKRKRGTNKRYKNKKGKTNKRRRTKRRRTNKRR